MIELAVGLPMLLLFLFGAADFGRLFYAAIEVANAAAAGANYGALKSTNMTDTAGIRQAAQNDAVDLSNLSVDSTKVCQDSSGNAVSCTTAGAYQYVRVTTTYTFQTLCSYPLIPSSVALSQVVMMRGK